MADNDCKIEDKNIPLSAEVERGYFFAWLYGNRVRLFVVVDQVLASEIVNIAAQVR